MTSSAITGRMGFLHLGDAAHGVSRYGRLLADGVRGVYPGDVVEHEIVLNGGIRSNVRQLREAARRFAGCDLVHIQHNAQVKRSVWGSGWKQISNLACFLSSSPVPVVVTMHDLPEPVALGAVLRRAVGRVRSGRDLRTDRPGSAERRIATPCAGDARGGGFGSFRRTIALRVLLRGIAGGFVCSSDEYRRIRLLPGADRIVVVPHFVEARPPLESPENAKKRLGLEGKRIVTLLGYIHPRKGWRILLQSAEHLPENVVIVFAGTGSSTYDAPETIMRIAAERGLGDRVRVTGYLPEPELETWMAATDLAVCPFQSVSASGSVSTWISAGRPILTSDLPLFAEYDRLVPGSIAHFTTYTATALAERIAECLTPDGAPPPDRRNELRDRLALPSIARAHMAEYGRIRSQQWLRIERRWRIFDGLGERLPSPFVGKAAASDLDHRERPTTSSK